MRALVLSLLSVVGVVGLVSCDSGTRFGRTASSEFFVQDFNPDFLDVVWVVDNRSPMYKVRTHLKDQATAFFGRLDALAGEYRMAVITSDTLVTKGKLMPVENPVILTKGLGTVEQRAQYFSSIITQPFNLHTGAENKGFENLLFTLQSAFVPKENTPLVVVFLSDSDDHSVVPSGDAVDYFVSQLVSLKGGDKNLVRVYSINLLKDKTDANRCTTLDQADIDVRSDFQDRYFRMADQLPGAKSNLCGAFSELMDLSGLKLKVLPSRFKLKAVPVSGTVRVEMLQGESKIEPPHWIFDAVSNEVVFDVAPPEGTTLMIFFDPT